MTDEVDLAIDWIRSQGWNEENLPSDELLQMEQAYLAGLKAGKEMAETDLATVAYMQGAERYRPKWHDLRKDPTDVPKENVTVLLLTEVEPVTARYDNKYEAFFRLGDKLDYRVFIAPMSYIAWCEIPKFKENE